jgi:THO complex subunit 3
MAWSPDGTTIAVGNKNDMVSFIDTRKFDVFREEQFNTEVNEFTWDPENARFFVTAASGHFRVLR